MSFIEGTCNVPLLRHSEPFSSVILSPPKAGEESLFKRDSSLGFASFRMTDGKKR